MSGSIKVKNKRLVDKQCIPMVAPTCYLQFLVITTLLTRVFLTSIRWLRAWWHQSAALSGGCAHSPQMRIRGTGNGMLNIQKHFSFQGISLHLKPFSQHISCQKCLHKHPKKILGRYYIEKVVHRLSS